MNANYNPGSTELRSIEQDDTDAVCDAYPPSRNVACAWEPRGGFDPGPEPEDEGGCRVAAAGRASSGSAAWLSLLAAAALWRRRHPSRNVPLE
jgi:MYXO-CTERM domain-containing protein